MENKRDEVEQKILRRVAVSLWLIIILIAIVAYLVKDVVVGGLREAIFVSTSIITQVYITNPDYASIIFLFAFIGKILLIYIVYVLILLFTEGLFKQSLEEGRIMRTIKKMKNHYIICGAGRVGGNVAEDLRKLKKPFVIIDKDLDSVDALKKMKVSALHGDSLDDSLLTKAGIKDAKALISCLDSDGDNILQIIVAKKLNKNLKIVSRAGHERFVPNLKHAGANEIIIPEVIGGQKIAEAALKFK